MAKARSTAVELPLTVTRSELLIDGSDREFRRFAHNLLAFASLLPEIRIRLAKQIGLTGAQYTVLIATTHLARTEGEIGINEVAKYLHLSGAFVTKEVNKLVAAGLINKTSNPTDGRRVTLTTTREARRRLEKISKPLQSINNTMFETLSAKEFTCMRAIMKRLPVSTYRALKLADFLLESSASVIEARYNP